jgi:DNA-binding transcriptional ArsR family regulator
MDTQKDTTQYPATGVHTKHQIELISKDNQAIFVYKKTERFSTAIYLVSNLMSDNEPLKWQLRTQTMSLMPIAGTLAISTISDKFNAIKKLTVSMIEILSLFEVAYKSQLMSEMNFKLLRKELVVFISEMSKPSLNLSTSGVSFDPEFFNLPHATFEGTQNTLDTQKEKPRSSVRKNTIKDTKVTQNNLSDNTQIVAVISPRTETKNTRKEAILKILKEKSGPLMIKDFSYVIKDCSEKTIQRELLSLVANGVLHKEGERRWSRYSLVGA